MNACEKCGTPLPDLAPGYVLATCRQCGTTNRVRTAAAQERPSTPGSHAPERGAAVLAPPHFVVEQGEGSLRIGWRHVAVEHFMLPVSIAAAAGAFVLLHQEATAGFGTFEWSLCGAVLAVALYPAIAALLNITWLEVKGDTLRCSSGPLPLHGSESLDVRSLRNVYVHLLAGRRYRGWVTFTRYTVRAQDHEGRTRTIASGLESEDDARWLAEMLRTRLGLKDGPQ